MITRLLFTALAASALLVACSDSGGDDPSGAGELISQTVEAGCGMCIFDMEGADSCCLAVRIDDQPYLVTGPIDFDHGDAHAADGICSTVREAEVEGKIDGTDFVATKLELKPKTE